VIEACFPPFLFHSPSFILDQNPALRRKVISMNKTNPSVALVTGASTAIGHATAKLCRVRASARSEPALARPPKDPRANLVDQVLAKAERIDLLVNNACIVLLGGAEESSTAQARALFDVNVVGVLRVTSAVLPAMRRQGKAESSI
jgi:NADP-dependent 3-hydroxy acid dehydrogenase YdfG